MVRCSKTCKGLEIFRKKNQLRLLQTRHARGYRASSQKSGLAKGSSPSCYDKRPVLIPWKAASRVSPGFVSNAQVNALPRSSIR